MYGIGRFACEWPCELAGLVYAIVNTTVECRFLDTASDRRAAPASKVGRKIVKLPTVASDNDHCWSLSHIMAKKIYSFAALGLVDNGDDEETALERLRQSAREHDEIAEATLALDADAGAALLKAHISKNRDYLPS